MSIAGKLSAAPILQEPFPHLICDDVLPDDLYRRVLDALPMDDPSDGFAYFRLDDATEPLQELEALWQREIFGAIVDRLLRYAATMFFEATGNDPDEKLGRALSRDDFMAGGILQHRTSGQVHGAHLDGAGALFTSVIYLCKPDADARDGTIFFNPVRPQRLLDGYRQRRNLGAWFIANWQPLFEEAKRVDYVANRMVAFVGPPHSWHGVAVGHNKHRHSVQTTCRLKQDPLAQIFDGWSR